MSAEDLVRILDELGQRLGPTGERAFALAVQYKVTCSLLWAIVSLVLLVGLAIAIVLAARYTQRAYQAEVERYEAGKGRWQGIRSGPDYSDYAFPWAIGGMLALFPVVTLFWVLVTSVITLLNPEYAALSDIIGAIR